MHFVRLATTLLKDEESARDNNVLACNFSKYSPIVKKNWRTQQYTFLNFIINILATP